MKLSKKKIIWFIVFALIAILVWLYPIIAPCRYNYKSENGGASIVFPGFYQKSVGFKIKEFLQEWLPPVFCVDAQVGQNYSTTDLSNLKNISPALTVSYDKINLFEAWNAIRTSSLFPIQSSVIIGIVDSGVDAIPQSPHPEFVGVDFGNSRPFSLVDHAEDTRSDLSEGHGTAVAGIIGANNISDSQTYIPPQMNGILSGVTNKYLLESRTAPLLKEFDVVAYGNIIKTIPQNAIVNMSMSVIEKDEDFIDSTRYFSQLFKKNSDKLFVVSAGNDGTNSLSLIPANVIEDNVIVVGATDISDNRASFSNFGGTVSISAPGEKLYTSTIKGKGDYPTSGIYQKNYSTNFLGTSASAPLVTGVAGLLKAIKPSLTPSQIKQILIRTADPIQTGETDKRLGVGCYSNPNDTLKTGCRLNAYRAVCDVDVLNCNTAHLNLSYTPNPAPISNQTCLDISPSWRYRATLAETAGVGATVNNFTWDFYDTNGTFLDRQTNTASDFANWFDDCGTGSSHIGANANVCGDLCVNYGGSNTGGSVVMTFNGTDDNGNSVSVFERETLSAPSAQVQSLTRSQNEEDVFVTSSGAGE
jgi:hypothetical protein